MKKLILLSAVLALGAMNVAQAAYLSPKRVMIPFFNEPILSDKHNGLLFEYDMNGMRTLQIRCDYQNDYKGWADYRLDGNHQTSGLNNTTIFTSKDDANYNQQQDQDVSIIHTDKTGTIRVKDFEHQGKIGTLSCQYQPDDFPVYK